MPGLVYFLSNVPGEHIRERPSSIVGSFLDVEVLSRGTSYRPLRDAGGQRRSRAQRGAQYPAS